MIGALFHSKKFFTAFRYGVAFIVFLEVFLAARLLPVAEFGKYSFVLQLATLFSFVGIAGGPGFTHHFYNSVRVKYGAYLVIYTLQMVAGLALLACVFDLLQWNSYLAASIFAVFLIPNMVLEPPLRVYNRFALAASFRLLISAISLSFLTYHFFTSGKGSLGSERLLNVTLLSYAVGSLSFTLLALSTLWKGFPIHAFGGGMKKQLTDYRNHFFRPGLASSSFSVLALVFANIDRILIDKTFSKEFLGIHSLASQIVTGLALYFTTRSYVIGVEVGEHYKTHNDPEKMMAYLKDQYKKLVVAGIYLFGGVLMITAGLQFFYESYQHLLLMVFLLGLGVLASNVGATGVPLLHYMGKMRVVTQSYMVLFGVVVLVNSLIARLHFPPITLVISTSFFQIFYAFYCYRIIKKILLGTPRPALAERILGW